MNMTHTINPRFIVLSLDWNMYANIEAMLQVTNDAHGLSKDDPYARRCLMLAVECGFVEFARFDAGVGYRQARLSTLGRTAKEQYSVEGYTTVNYSQQLGL